MKIMRLNYTNVGIAAALLAVCFIFFKLSQRSPLVATQAKTAVQDQAFDGAENQLKKALETIDYLERDLSEARRIKTKINRMELGKRKFSGHRLVHLDLKGAPPKIDYLIKMLPDFATWGATGLLVEYEDMFPYNGKYEVLRAKNSYSEAEIKDFLETASENELLVIPLVQTFGHLEFVLKHEEFSHLRETEHFTNSLCPNSKESVPMVLEMVEQVLALHPDVQWFHIGGDEVWNLKTCSVCMKDERNKSQLFVHHMTPILKYLKTKDVTPIMWDDMMRMWPVDYLKELGGLVEPMVWAYRGDIPLSSYLPPGMWERYGQAFKNIWAASAFKGATHPWSNFVPIGYHVQNNLNWLDVFTALPSTLKMTGIALTGWSRYDHYATMCELLPAALPSLAFCLQALRHGYMDEELTKSIAEKLGLPETFPLTWTRFNDKYHPPDGNFPGHEIFKFVGEMEKTIYDARGVSNIENGWLLDRQVESKFLSYYQVESAYNKTVHGLQILIALRKEAETVLSPVYDDSVVREWVKDKIDGSINHLNSEKAKIEPLRKVAADHE